MINKLLKIQSELKAPKGQRNSFGNYNYRSAEDILEAVKPLLKENGLTMTISDEIVEVGGRIYVKATVTVAEGENKVQVNAFARESETKKGMDDSQITGTASSYARKYALNGMFLIDDTKDADTDEYQKKTRAKAEPRAPKKEELITAGGADYLMQLCIEVNSDPAKVCEYYGVTNFKEMTTAQFEKASKQLESKRK